MQVNPKTLLSRISDSLNRDLPGKEAQLKMSRFGRSNEISIDFRVAAVLILIFPKEDELHFILTKRASKNSEDIHSGQISFPGGSREISDFELSQTALRETNEEIGIQKDKISVLGQLTELYIPVSNFMVYPFLGYINEQPLYIPQIEEVEEIIEAPLELLLDPQTIHYKDINIRDGFTIKDIPYFNIYNHVVWGATAMILSEFKEIIEQIKADKS